LALLRTIQLPSSSRGLVDLVERFEQLGRDELAGISVPAELFREVVVREGVDEDHSIGCSESLAEVIQHRQPQRPLAAAIEVAVGDQLPERSGDFE